MAIDERRALEVPAGISQKEPAFFDQQTGAFFRRVDWLAFGTTFLVTFAVYFYTLAPTVTLEDSGELAVASDYLGVPHPPGYPIWTLITWFFQWIFHWVKYFGSPDGNLTLVWKSLQHLFGSHVGTAHPNPAWAVGLASAFFGAIACGLQAMLVSRSCADMLRSMKQATEVLGFRTETLFSWVGGVASGLLLAFSPVMWSQSVIVEVYALNAFFQILTLLLAYRWMCRPKEDKTLYITAFIFGLGLTNHQTLLFVAVGLLAAIWYRDRPLFRDCLAGICLFMAGLMYYKAYQLGAATEPAAVHTRQMNIAVGTAFLLGPLGLYLIDRKLMTEWRRVAIAGVLSVIGLSFYAYLPFASEQNPPMNWGYPRTVEGFWHAISRGQYEKITPADVFTVKFLHQVWSYLLDLKSQYSTGIAAIGLVPFLMLVKLDRRARTWLFTTMWAFFSLGIVLVTFQNPQLDIQTLFIGRVQFIQSHAVYALWVGYGLIMALTWLETLAGGRGVAKFLGVAAVGILPLILVWQNYYDKEQIKIVGGAEQNGHDFGWQFGAWELEGARAILAEIDEAEKAAFPNPAYPPPMESNAVFFGGTDPGRFVPTYMIYSAKYRPDVYLITQNALADNTYMNVMRDLYGDTIWIPSQQDSNYAFKKYVDDIQAGRIPAGAEVNFEGGRVSVQGVQGVMTINGILARMIFEANKNKHAFFVEESYVIPWMYPYLEPHGLIMKINREPLPGLTPEMAKNDRQFWDWYSKRLLANPKFLVDVVARKTFSKLRSAIAGLYAARRMYNEAEYAFKQSIELYPLSPEANFRLADTFMQQFKFTEARQLIEAFLTEDPDNDKVADFLNQIRGTEQLDARRRDLEVQLQKGGTVDSALELADVYRRMNLGQLCDSLAMNILNQSNIPPAYLLKIGDMYAQMRRMDMLVLSLERYVQREPSNPKVWIDLAALYANTQRTDDALNAIRRALAVGGDPVRDIIRKDQRFAPLQEHPQFRTLVPAAQPSLNIPLGLPGL